MNNNIQLIELLGQGVKMFQRFIVLILESMGSHLLLKPIGAEM